MPKALTLCRLLEVAWDRAAPAARLKGLTGNPALLQNASLDSLH